MKNLNNWLILLVVVLVVAFMVAFGEIAHQIIDLQEKTFRLERGID